VARLFSQTDPIGYGDGPNIYAYVHGDPVNGTDPSWTSCDHLWNLLRWACGFLPTFSSGGASSGDTPSVSASAGGSSGGPLVSEVVVVGPASPTPMPTSSGSFGGGNGGGGTPKPTCSASQVEPISPQAAGVQDAIGIADDLRQAQDMTALALIQGSKDLANRFAQYSSFLGYVTIGASEIARAQLEGLRS
jgi:uncharacterized protein RhaS with RHS repeats